jgi:hypothetical protein
MDRAGGHPPVEALFNPAELRAPLNGAMSPRWLRMVESGIGLERDWIERAGGPDRRQAFGTARAIRQELDPDPHEIVRSLITVDMPAAMRAAIADWLRARQEGVWQQVARTTHARLSATLAAGLKAGDSTTALRDRVKAALTRYADAEARRVARTEATAAMNLGEDLARAEAGIQWKEWIATIDSRTRGADPKKKSRFNHYAAHGQKVSQTGLFIVSGQKLKFPGDSSRGASAGNLVNCRCASVAAFDPPAAQPVSYPASPKAIPIPPVPEISHVGETSADFRKMVESTIKALPAKVLTGIRSAGITVRTGEFLTDAAPLLKSAKVPKQLREWNNIEGVFTSGKFPQVAVAEKYTLSDTTRASDRIDGVTRHEFGHAADCAFGLRSRRLLRTAFASDLERLPSDQEGSRLKKRLDYFLIISEAIAEGFAIINGGGAAPWIEEDFRRAFPRTIAALARIFAEVE